MSFRDYAEGLVCSGCGFCVMDGEVARCHRDPPMIRTPGQPTEFPVIDPDGWCGGFRGQLTAPSEG